MKEGDKTRAFGTACKLEMPGAFYQKHSDSFTSGIPDSTVNWNHRTCWVEAKLLRQGHTLLGKSGELRQDQLTRCIRLEQTSVCTILAYHVGKVKGTAFYRPGALRGLEADLSPALITVDDSSDDWVLRYITRGAIIFPNIDHARAAQFVRALLKG